MQFLSKFQFATFEIIFFPKFQIYIFILSTITSITFLILVQNISHLSKLSKFISNWEVYNNLNIFCTPMNFSIWFLASKRFYYKLSFDIKFSYIRAYLPSKKFSQIIIFNIFGDFTLKMIFWRNSFKALIYIYLK